ncbi:MAG: indolepyruvate oxidoreductase subunit beta [Promethearchaeota archaeon]|nr:MAG: indolepyruvate oxidoreductase subunit beta [Candidatus Lokiarchaeota archaeon]
MSFENYTIVITGLGGQGSILLLQILGNTLMSQGYKVITSETHGLSQRGGNVTCFLRFGNKLSAPIPMMGSADMIIALEESSILNALKYAKQDKSTKLVISTYENPVRGMEYPSIPSLLNKIYEYSDNLYFIPALEIVKKHIGNPKTMNIIILGYILRFLTIKRDVVEDSLKEFFSGKKLEINLKAFNEGYEIQ